MSRYEDSHLNSVYDEKIIRELIEKEEGGWVLSNSLHDPDEATYAGLRIEMARKFFNIPDLTPQQFACMPQDEIIRAFKEMYFIPAKIGAVLHFSQNTNLARAYFSAYVNLNPVVAVKILQDTIVNVTVKHRDLKIDGVIGTKTLEALQAVTFYASSLYLQKQFVVNWIVVYINLVQANVEAQLAGKTKLKRHMNLEGWFNRAARFLP